MFSTDAHGPRGRTPATDQELLGGGGSLQRHAPGRPRPHRCSGARTTVPLPSGRRPGPRAAAAHAVRGAAALPAPGGAPRPAPPRPGPPRPRPLHPGQPYPKPPHFRPLHIRPPHTRPPHPGPSSPRAPGTHASRPPRARTPDCSGTRVFSACRTNHGHQVLFVCCFIYGGLVYRQVMSCGPAPGARLGGAGRSGGRSPRINGKRPSLPSHRPAPADAGRVA